jgi:hypothetical protein
MLLGLLARVARVRPILFPQKVICRFSVVTLAFPPLEFVLFRLATLTLKLTVIFSRKLTILLIDHDGNLCAVFSSVGRSKGFLTVDLACINCCHYSTETLAPHSGQSSQLSLDADDGNAQFPSNLARAVVLHTRCRASNES